ncbi:S49 family peptidase [Rhizobium ruizarguesonis]
MRDLPHLASLIFNRPLLVRADIGRQIIDAIGPRVLTGESMGRADIAADIQRAPREARSGSSRRLAGGAYMERDGIAVLPIVGSLVRRGTWLDAECGMMSYGLIRDATAEILMDPSVRGLMLEYDSGGGEANGCFDCADFIRSASIATGKPVWAHANEIMCSAAYALGSSADRIWVARTAEVGSIGVLGAHVDVSEADKAAGVKWTYIYAGEHKTDGNSHEPLGEGPRARMQADVDHLYEMFLELSSQNRGMTAEELRATKADIYRGSLAVEAGLADEVGTLDEALEAFAEHVDDLQTSGGAVLSKSQLRVGLMVRKTGKTVASADAGSEGITEAPEPGATEAVDAGADDVTGPEPAEEEIDDAKVAAIVDRRLKAETARCSGLHAVAQQASRLGVSFNAVEAINKGMSVDVARAKVLAAAADGDSPETSAIAVPKNVAAAGAGGQNTMSADAKKSAWGKAIKRR